MGEVRTSPWVRAGGALLRTFQSLLRNEVPSSAASISYFTLFALFPAFLVLIAVVNVFLGWVDLKNRVLQRILELFPGSRGFLASYLSEITEPSPLLVFACLVILIWSSTWIFIFVETALNRTWGVPKRRSFWQSRTRSFAVMTLSGILLLTSTGITGFIRALRAAARARISQGSADPILDWFWSFMLLGIGLLIATLVFLLIYKLIPDRKVRWSEALSGAIVSALLWEGASYLFAWMVPYFNYQRIYGRMGAIIALLIWVYVSGVIMLFGAAFSVEIYHPNLGAEYRASGRGTQATSRQDRKAFRNTAS